MRETLKLDREWDKPRCHEGEWKLSAWERQGTRWKVLDASEMKWFWGMTTYPSDLKTHEDPVYEASHRRLNIDEVTCDEVLEDGTLCDFVGMKAAVGVHKYYCHGNEPLSGL